VLQSRLGVLIDIVGQRFRFSVVIRRITDSGFVRRTDTPARIIHEGP